EDAQAILVDVALHLVDLVIDFTNLLGQPGIGFDQRRDSVIDLLLDQPAHGQEMAADLFQFGVELLGNMLGMAVFVHHLCPYSAGRAGPWQSCRARRRRADSTTRTASAADNAQRDLTWP